MSYKYFGQTLKGKFIYIFLVLLLVSGCDFFSPRDPETPDTDNSGFVPPTSPDIVISNLERAVDDLNVDDYMACFGETSFYFEASGEEQLKYLTIFTAWDLNSERSYFNAIIGKQDGPGKSNLEFEQIEQEPIVGDSTVFSSCYFWEIENVEIDSSIFRGKLRFTLSRDESGLWSIHRWIDYRDEEYPTSNTWSSVKAVFSN